MEAKIEDFGDECFPVVRPLGALKNRIQIGELKHQLGSGTKPMAIPADTAVLAELDQVVGSISEPGGARSSKLICSLKGGAFLVVNRAVVNWETEKAELTMLFPPARIAIKSALLGRKNKPYITLYVPCAAAVEFVGLGREDEAAAAALVKDRAAVLRTRGNQKYMQEQYVLSSLFYAAAGSAAAEGELNERVIASSNHAECMIKLQRYEDAISSCDKALDVDPRHAKSLYRKGLALSALQSHAEALSAFRTALGFSSSHTMVAEVQAAVTRSAKLAHQQRTGIYDVKDFFLNGLTAEHAPECSDFMSGSVEIRMTGDGKGRGVFLTRDVKVGEVLMVSNPVVASPLSAGDEAFELEAVRACGRSSRACGIIHSLADSHSMTVVPCMQDFGHGSGSRSGVVIDVRRVTKVTALAAFNYRLAGPDTKMKLVYGLPALINHSCLPNSSAVVVGNALFVRAAKPLKAGDEITITYIECLMPLAYRSRTIRRGWGFTCTCGLCKVEKRFKAVLDRIPEPTLNFKDYEDVIRVNIESVCEVEKALVKLSTKATDEEKAMIRVGHAEAYLLVCCNMQEEECREVGRKFQLPSLVEVMGLLHDLAPGHLKSIFLSARIELRFLCGRQRTSDLRHVAFFNDAFAALTGDASPALDARFKICELCNSDELLYSLA